MKSHVTIHIWKSVVSVADRHSDYYLYSIINWKSCQLSFFFLHYKSMSVKSKISSLSKLYSFYEKIPEDYLDESDVDAYFYHNILDITPSQHRIFRVGKGPNNKLFVFKVFQSRGYLRRKSIKKVEKTEYFFKHWL